MRRISRYAALALTACLAGPVSALAEEAGHDPHGTAGEPPWSQADAHFGPAEMAAARASLLHHHGGVPFWFVAADRLEIQSDDDADYLVWDMDAAYGGDIDKLYIKTEGEYAFEEDEFEELEAQLLWSRAVSPFWDFQAGIGHEFETDDLTFATVGYQGTAPYDFSVDAAAYVSEEGDATASAEIEHELLLLQHLFLRPRVAVTVAFQDIPERHTGAGFAGLDAGLRFGYEFDGQYAPYIGIEWQGDLGETRRMAKAEGEDASRTVLVAGLEVWF